jgi:hypothetical protein
MIDLLSSCPLRSILMVYHGCIAKYCTICYVYQMFHRVHMALATGQNLGIFPEGGSHDNTHLLPLKVLGAYLPLHLHRISELHRSHIIFLSFYEN